MDVTIEYLVIIEKRTSEALFRLCDSLEAFDKFLQTEPSIKIANGRIQHDGGFAFGYDVKTGEVKGKEQRFFHVKLSSPKNDEATIEELVKLSRRLKGLIHAPKHSRKPFGMTCLYSTQNEPMLLSIVLRI